ncbi:hypothetical protein DPMN_076230 [Dreissena polymorpha]|uniref:Uncharacterized protein n=1 Tax=Dreissena polymorpha TaxID=45954 RepID=A0A9D3YIQ6_DREPO|nr:hypothetical protein DPMN_076230 [Dreissena polymorpha]
MSTADSEEPGSVTHDRREPSEEPASLSHDRREPNPQGINAIYPHKQSLGMYIGVNLSVGSY